jgi:hypothetical protein
MLMDKVRAASAWLQSYALKGLDLIRPYLKMRITKTVAIAATVDVTLVVAGVVTLSVQGAVLVAAGALFVSTVIVVRNGFKVGFQQMREYFEGQLKELFLVVEEAKAETEESTESLPSHVELA